MRSIALVEPLPGPTTKCGVAGVAGEEVPLGVGRTGAGGRLPSMMMSAAVIPAGAVPTGSSSVVLKRSRTRILDAVRIAVEEVSMVATSPCAPGLPEKLPGRSHPSSE
ncbi:MAG TPA: hypothetical protein VHI13_18575 [Candidatus Kapabacteria bacterium]|nr:hypothetical protein [Candidatus Kapabacteria bacterium]